MEMEEGDMNMSPQGTFLNAIINNNEDIFMRHIGFKRKDRCHPIDISLAAKECCKYGRIGMLKNLMTFRPNVNMQDGVSKRCLHYAAFIGSMEMVKLVINAGSSVNCYDKMSYCPIHYACENGHAEIVQYLITRGAHVTFSKILSTGESPLHVACRAGSAEVVKVLLLNGADIHAKLEQSQNCQFSPLHVAAKWEKFEVVETLCSHGASVNMKSSKGHTPLHVSAQLGDLNCIKILLEFGADVSIRGEKGYTPILFAIFDGHVEVVRTLLSWEPNVLAHNGETLSALMTTLSGPQLECFELLLQAGADVNEQNLVTQESVLMFAVGLSDVVKVRLLLQHDADVNVGDHKMYTPLHRAQIIKASDSLKVEMSKMLMKAGAKINAPDKEGFTPLHRAIFTNVIRCNQVQSCIKLLVEAGSRLWPGPEALNRNSQSPLCWLTWNKQLPVADYLVQAGWEMNRESWVNIKPSCPQQWKLHIIFQDTANNTRTLKHCCRKEIRRYFTNITDDLEIVSCIELLPLPNSLKNYLCLKDCDFKDPEYFENL